MQHVIRVLAAAVALAAGLATADAHGVKTRTIEIVHPWTFGRGQGDGVQVFMKIKNSGRHDDRLVGAQSPLAASASLVETNPQPVPGPRPVLDPRPVRSIVITAGGQVELSSSAQSILLGGFKKPLSAYDTFILTLIFERAGRIEVEVLVEELPAGHKATE